MKTILRNIAIYSLILFLLQYIVSGFSLSGGIWTLFVGGIILTFLFLIIKPILSIISFPVNMITLGLVNLLINTLLLYLLTILVVQISISPFTYPRIEIFGVIIPSLSFNTFFAYVYTAFVLSCIKWLISWLTE